MSMFTLIISCLTSSLPWFMNLTFQVSVLYCSLQHWTLVSPPDTSTTGHCFHFDSASSLLLEICLHSFPVAYWAPTNLGSSSFVSYLFAFTYCPLGSQGKNAEMLYHSLLHWTMFCHNSPPWPICLGWPFMAWLVVSLSYTRLWSMWSVLFIFCDCGFWFCLPSDG